MYIRTSRASGAGRAARKSNPISPTSAYGASRGIAEGVAERVGAVAVAIEDERALVGDFGAGRDIGLDAGDDLDMA